MQNVAHSFQEYSVILWVLYTHKLHGVHGNTQKNACNKLGMWVCLRDSHRYDTAIALQPHVRLIWIARGHFFPPNRESLY